MIRADLISPIKMTDDNNNLREDWLLARLGKITSSQVYKLCAPKGFGDVGRGYIRTRAFERIAKVSAEKEITTPSMISGLIEEGNTLRNFKKRNNIDSPFLRVQVLINGADSAYSTTPDGIWILSATEKDGITHYNAKTIETKGFEPLRHMECIEAETAKDVKEIDYKSYIQTLDQMIVSDCLEGVLIYGNSQLPENKGGYKEIRFRQVELLEDVRFIKARKELAKQEIEKIVNKLTQQ